MRIGIFVLTLSILLVIVPDWMLAAILAAMISFAISIIFLRKQRDAMSAHIYFRSQQRRDGLNKPGAKDDENDLLDGKGE